MTETLSSPDLADRLVKAESLIGNLERALINARVIGAAVGIIMASQKVAYDAAFGLLANASQTANTKLSELAELVVLTGAVPTL